MKKIYYLYNYKTLERSKENFSNKKSAIKALNKKKKENKEKYFFWNYDFFWKEN